MNEDLELLSCTLTDWCKRLKTIFENKQSLMGNNFKGAKTMLYNGTEIEVFVKEIKEREMYVNFSIVSKYKTVKIRLVYDIRLDDETHLYLEDRLTNLKKISKALNVLKG